MGAVVAGLVRNRAVDYQPDSQIDADAVKIGKIYAKASGEGSTEVAAFRCYLRVGYALTVKRRSEMRAALIDARLDARPSARTNARTSDARPSARSDVWSLWLTNNHEALGFGSWTASLLMRVADRFEEQCGRDQSASAGEFGSDCSESEALAGLRWMEDQQRSPVDIAIEIRKEIAEFQRTSSPEALRAEMLAAVRAALLQSAGPIDPHSLVENLERRGVAKLASDRSVSEVLSDPSKLHKADEHDHRNLAGNRRGSASRWHTNAGAGGDPNGHVARIVAPGTSAARGRRSQLHRGAQRHERWSPRRRWRERRWWREQWWR
jgi:hypothetical protein